MSTRPNVGQSFERTFCKHTFLNKCSGKFAGVASCLPLDLTVLIDCCAGNWIASQFSQTSSPEIFAKHLKFLHDRGRSARLYLIEADRKIFEQLQVQVDLFKSDFPQLNSQLVLINGDYRSAAVAAQVGPFPNNSAVFLYVDPNAANQVELSQELRRQLPRLTTWMVTLGANVGGNKRSALGERQKWLERLNYLLGCVQPHQDACLLRLENDNCQWAYLLNAPLKWHSDTETVIGSLHKLWPKGITHYWHSEGKLLPAAQALFLTKAELDAMRQPRLF
jgi:hypothetical protein